MSDRGTEQRQKKERRPPKGLRYVVYAGLGLVVLLMLALGGSVFLFGTGPAGPPYPGANFQFEYDEPNRSLLVYHAGGQNLTADTTARVTVRINGTTNGQFSPPIAEGDGVRLRGVEPNREIQVVWHGREGATIQVASTITGQGNASTTNATTTG